MKKLYVYKDAKGWSAQIAKAAAKRDDAKVLLFYDAMTVPSGSDYFVRMDQQAEKRDECKQVVAELWDKGCKGIPTIQEAHWYDNKLAQYKALKKWLPNTQVIAAYDGDIEYPPFPFISKSSEGASSANVRVVNNKQEADEEIKQAFEGDGMTLKYGRKQDGYLYWQEMIPNDGTFRVTVTLGMVWGYYRKNDPKTGLVAFPAQGHQLDIANEDDVAVMDMCWNAAKEIGTDWMAFDMIKDKRDGSFYMLEMSSAWPHKKDIEMGCPMWVMGENGWEDSGLKGRDLMGELLGK